MDTITQHDALGSAPLDGGERAHFFTIDRFDGLECLTAVFRTHRYAPHMHDTFALGAIIAGCESWTVRGARNYAGPGDLVFINPHEVHDGEPRGDGYSYRMSYPAVPLLRRIGEEVAGRSVAGTPKFPETVVHDPDGVALFVAAHRAADAGHDTLAADELMVRAYAHCLMRHAQIAPASIGREAATIARLKAIMTERHAEDLSLDELAAEAGLSRHHLIRAFRRETGLTPHAFLIDRRISAARERLRHGESPAEVAAATGFADQAHLTRAFKARVGVTPGAYRAAVTA